MKNIPVTIEGISIPTTGPNENFSFNGVISEESDHWIGWVNSPKKSFGFMKKSGSCFGSGAPRIYSLVKEAKSESGDVIYCNDFLK